jgi:hypothetical protein
MATMHANRRGAAARVANRHVVLGQLVVPLRTRMVPFQVRWIGTIC